MISMKTYAGGLYGIEAGEVKDEQVASMSAAVMDVFNRKNNRHDVDWFYSTSHNGKNLDPQVQVVTRRVIVVRKAVAENQN